uniref:Phosphatidylinositol transfer protein membrane associated 2 n=1 Tax=Pavo cristatus TaxID=9049 RepID=A0A8C9FS24_PAVCR
MLIKEYRIPLPMSVEEYRIAQLYMIQKKSREETCGEGSGVEILENRPYMDGPGGNGQYTHKVYHIGMHIPSWFRSILPKAALRVEEESWNAYPYTRTRYTCPFVEKFSIDIETYYKTDPGEHVNVFNLSPAEKRQTILDPIDIVKDPIPPHEYKAEEDPKLYKSVKTKRGPLSEDWIQEYRNNPGKYPIMCAYKLCKVEFRYWGMQSKIERFIHDVGDAFLQRTHNSSSSKDHVGNSLSCRSSVSHKAFLLFPASPSRHSISEWRMQSIARDSDDSSDDEFFDAHGMWNLNRLCSLPEVNFQSNFDCSHLVNCFGVISFFPCNDTKKLCSTAFILYVVLNMYHWLSCYSSFCKYNPALLLTVISELKSKGSSPPHLCCLFQVCLVGDCVGGILGFDALCYSNQTVSESQNSSRRGSFYLLPPFNIPRYQRFPLGDGNSAVLADVVQSHGAVFMESASLSTPISAPQFRGFRRASEISIASQVSGMADSYTASNIANIAAKWWGTKRIDYALYCPDALTAFPTVALPHLFHASYWESTDVVSFLLRQVMRHENSSVLELDGKEVSVFTPSKPREKWLRKRTHVKLRNVTANHRINDTIANEDGPQTLTGRFMYGPLDMVTLTGEKVDIHIMTQPPSGEWVYFDTEISNSSGRISYVIPENRRLGIGVYPVKMVVRGDHTFADSYITVLPKGTEFVVFSIDGSFAASVSIMGSDPKVRAGAVDVVRHWQDLGYLIIYVTGRPDMQKQRVVAWLAQHNFPHGIVSFCDGLVHDPLRHKANFLKSLITDLHMRIHAAYGSTKDISVYSSISLPPTHIYIVGRPTKKLQSQCQFITEGYAAHLAQLEYNHRSRPAKNTTRMALRKGSFGLPSQTEFLRKRNHLLRTISSQPSAAGGSAGHRPERTQSQSDGDKERDRERSQRSMSIATGCWGRSAASRLESGLLGQK